MQGERARATRTFEKRVRIDETVLDVGHLRAALTDGCDERHEDLGCLRLASAALAFSESVLLASVGVRPPDYMLLSPWSKTYR
jgi:hypothetical protein